MSFCDANSSVVEWEGLSLRSHMDVLFYSWIALEGQEWMTEAHTRPFWQELQMVNSNDKATELSGLDGSSLCGNLSLWKEIQSLEAGDKNKKVILVFTLNLTLHTWRFRAMVQVSRLVTGLGNIILSMLSI